MIAREKTNLFRGNNSHDFPSYIIIQYNYDEEHQDLSWKKSSKDS